MIRQAQKVRIYPTDEQKQQTLERFASEAVGGLQSAQVLWAAVAGGGISRLIKVLKPIKRQAKAYLVQD